MRFFRSAVTALLLACFCSSCGEAGSRPYEVVNVVDGGRLRVMVSYRGEPLPERRRLEVNVNVEHCRGKVLSEELVVDPATRGIRDVVVRLEEIERGKAAVDALVITNRDCAFHPHVSAAMTGSLLKTSNEDPLTHSTHPYYGDRTFFNYQLSGPGDSYPGRKLPGPGLVTVRCDVHNWMRAYVLVHDNPYLGVTDADGALVIDGIPPGSYPYVAWHESLGEARGTIEISARGESGLRRYLGPEK